MNNPLHWGIIGCGDVTEYKSGPAFYNLPQTCLQAVMRRNGEAAADYARRHGVAEHYDDANRIINHPELDAVYIATPPSSHADYAIRALEAGKAVYVEKPMALNEAECEAMVEASKRTGSPLFVAYYRREMTYFKEVKRLLEEGRIGEPFFADVKLSRNPHRDDYVLKRPGVKNLMGVLPWRLSKAIAGGGYVVDMGSHQINLLLWLFGAVSKFDGSSFNRAGLYKVEDGASLNISFRNGCEAYCEWDFVSVFDEDIFCIYGTKGILQFSTFDMSKIEIINFPTEAGREHQIETIRFMKPAVVEQAMISHVSDLILARESDERALEDAVETTRILDQIVAANEDPQELYAEVTTDSIESYPKEYRKELVDLGEEMSLLNVLVGSHWRPYFLIDQRAGEAYRLIDPSNRLTRITLSEVSLYKLSDLPSKAYNRARTLNATYPVTISRFENDRATMTWQINPDGAYFMDADGYGMTDDEEISLRTTIDRRGFAMFPFELVKK